MERREARYRARRAGIVRPTEVDPESVMRVLRVAPELAGTRLDRFLQGQLRATSRSRSQLIIERCAFSPEGQPLKKNRRVGADERIILWRPPWDELAPELEVPVLYEDGDLVAVDKPPFVPVHPTARFHKSTITELLASQRPHDRLTLLHRLDRETSGVLLLARTREADRAVKIQFEERRDVVKRYLALSWNEPTWERTTCELPLEPDAGGRYRVKMRIAPPGRGQPSATTFELLERRRHPDSGRSYSLIRCTLHSGRQHQIRVHLTALGLPLVGDKLYGPDETLFARGADGTLRPEDLALLEHDRQALHACDIRLEHPATKKTLFIDAPLAHDLASFWDRLRS
jgi:23S rRNA pseudouridine1911/1915/1917 synthase